MLSKSAPPALPPAAYSQIPSQQSTNSASPHGSDYFGAAAAKCENPKGTEDCITLVKEIIDDEKATYTQMVDVIKMLMEHLQRGSAPENLITAGTNLKNNKANDETMYDKSGNPKYPAHENLVAACTVLANKIRNDNNATYRDLDDVITLLLFVLPRPDSLKKIRYTHFPEFQNLISPLRDKRQQITRDELKIVDAKIMGAASMTLANRDATTDELFLALYQLHRDSSYVLHRDPDFHKSCCSLVSRYKKRCLEEIQAANFGNLARVTVLLADAMVDAYTKLTTEETLYDDNVIAMGNTKLTTEETLYDDNVIAMGKIDEKITPRPYCFPMVLARLYALCRQMFEFRYGKNMENGKKRESNMKQMYAQVYMFRILTVIE